MEIIFDKVDLIINKRTPLEKTILKDISFEIKDNGIYSFVGASSSGKTAIGDLISAITYPTKGTVIVKGKNNKGKVITDINKLRSSIGYVYKNPYKMFFCSTVREELEFGMKHFKYKTNSINKRVLEALELVDLDESYLNLDPNILSLIDAKKVALASILSYNPSIIILDEFTNGLGVKEKKDLIRLFKLLKNKYNKTIILLTKDTSFAYEASDKVYLMYYSHIIADGDRSILRERQILNHIGLEIPPIVDFVDIAHKKGHDINYYVNIQDLIKGVYNDVF